MTYWPVLAWVAWVAGGCGVFTWLRPGTGLQSALHVTRPYGYCPGSVLGERGSLDSLAGEQTEERGKMLLSSYIVSMLVRWGDAYCSGDAYASPEVAIFVRPGKKKTSGHCSRPSGAELGPNLNCLLVFPCFFFGGGRGLVPPCVDSGVICFTGELTRSCIPPTPATTHR